MTECPNDQTLASFIDGRLSASARNTVVEHVAECGDCREVVVEANQIEAELAAEEGAPHVVRPSFGRKRLATVAATFAAAAALVIVFGAPLRERLFGGEMSSLVDAAKTVSVRPGEGRLSADFDYRQARERKRGEEDEQAQLWRVMAETAELESARRPNLHALGVAHLYLGREDQAITELSSALEQARDGEKRTAIATDLAAALISRRDEGDAERALALMESEWRTRKTPAVAWNRATALQAVGRDAEALRAWDDYLQLDPSSAWAVEARTYRDSLR